MQKNKRLRKKWKGSMIIVALQRVPRLSVTFISPHQREDAHLTANEILGIFGLVSGGKRGV